MTRGHAISNPVANTEDPEGNGPRKRWLDDDEIKQVWAACSDDDLGRIVKLLLLTGCRRDEIGALKWSEVDMARETITLPS